MKNKVKVDKWKRVFFIAVLVLGCLGVLATVVALPVSTSITLGTVFPAMVGVIFIAYGWVKLKRKRKLIPYKWLRVVVTVIVCLGVALFVVIEGIIITYANIPPPDEDVNYCIVLGAGIFPDGRMSLSLKIRLDNAVEYLEEHEDVICIVSGGQGDTEPVAEAYAMRDYLISQGIAQSRILTEANSFSTHDNMTLSALVMKEYDADLEKTAVIVTNDFHIFRSLAVAKNRGITGYGLPCVTPLLVKVTSYMREFLTIVNTFLFQMN
ncbi:MAG: YdcF family protein [Clostridia bacterium]|nr:YdcF family protein [Clostridia bacterium]MBT7123169.1 YdcF family protein [Clostridia bacterium]